MGEEKKKLSISIVCKRRPQKTSSLFAAIDDAPGSAPAPARQYVAEFDPSQTLTPAVAPVVIAPLPNSGIFGRRKPSPLLAARSTAAAGLAAFVLDTSAADPSSSTHYGLTRRDAADASDRGMDEFRDMPVEGFGAAILAGYGLIVTKGEDTKVARRGARHGLGYNPSEPDKDCKRSGGKRSRTEEDCQENDSDARRKRPCGEKRSRTEACKELRDGRGSSRVRWLQSHIRVRVASEKLGKRLYLTKGKVVDVVSPTTCDVVMDDGLRLVQGVEQGMLETVLPPTNGLVLVLYGEHRGVRGRLVEKNAEEEVGLVEDLDTKGMIRVGYDQMAEFTGDLE
ncbi:protein MOS2-like [Miscanthus floridulus]|uniref:protein MOS2-like n=1 Tax=Miscanthus floridulus TaxID=154761 RepID=UPI0034581165